MLADAGPAGSAGPGVGAPRALDALATWGALLRDVGALGDGLCAAIETGDPIAAIATTMQLRRVRTELVRVEAPARAQGERAELAAMTEVAAQVMRARDTEAVMTSWLSRPLPPEAALLGSPLGVAVLADALLPAVWDFETEVVVLVGGALAPVAHVLADLGQRRIIVVDADRAAAGAAGAAGGLPAGAIAVRSASELVLALRTLVPLPPTQFVVRAVEGTDIAQAEEIVEATRETLLDLRVYRNTLRSFSATWVEQGLANLPALARWPSVAALDDAFVGKPMVIVAPGPSLAKNIAQVRALKGRAIIVAFSHSLKPVLAAGIEPDLVMTVDPQDVRYHFEGCDLGGACLVNAATVHPTLFELPATRALTLSANCAVDDWLFDAVGEEALVPGGGSVATSAFSLGLRWRCDPIVFVGLDLSFSGGQYYVGTSSDGDARAEVDTEGVMRVAGWSPAFAAMKAKGGPAASPERAIALPAWDGSDATVPSSFMFGLFHRWFVEELAALERRGVCPTVFNCTEGGAAIPGMVHRPLADVIPQLAAPLDVGATLDCAIAATDGAARGARVAARVTTYLRGLRRCRALAGEALALARSPGPAASARLARVERALSRALAPLGFASLLATRELERAEDVARHAGTAATYLAASTALFAALVRVIDQLAPALAAFSAGVRA